MKQSRYTDSQIINILKQAEAGTPVPELCREHGMSNASFYKWRAKYGGMDASLMGRMKELEAENTFLRNLAEGLARGSVNRLNLERIGEPLDGHVAITRVELNAIAASACLFGGQQRGALLWTTGTIRNFEFCCT